MRNSKYNQEGYPDPTAYRAFSNIAAERREQRHSVQMNPQHVYKPLVYICSPYSDDILNNERKARVYSKFAARQGVIPITPHLLYPQFLDENDPADRELGLFFGIVLLTKCEQLWVFGSHISSGMAKEIYKAECKGMRIRYFTEDCVEVNRNE